MLQKKKVQKDALSLTLKTEEGGPYAKECRWPPDAGKGKEVDAVLEPLEKTQSL